MVNLLYSTKCFVRFLCLFQKVVKWCNYIEKKGLLNPCGSIAHTVFELYKTEEILHGLEDMLSCILPCLEFQYPDWCYVENLSNKISRLVQRKSLQKLYSERRKNDGCQHMDNR